MKVAHAPYLSVHARATRPEERGRSGEALVPRHSARTARTGRRGGCGLGAGACCRALCLRRPRPATAALPPQLPQKVAGLTAAG